MGATEGSQHWEDINQATLYKDPSDFCEGNGLLEGKVEMGRPVKQGVWARVEGLGQALGCDWVDPSLPWGLMSGPRTQTASEDRNRST